MTAAGGANISNSNFGRYPLVTVPLLALHGDADTSTDPTGTSELVDALASADKEFVLLPGVRHSLLDDVDAADTRKRIINWLDQRAARPSD